MSIGRKWKEIIDVNDKISFSFHVSFQFYGRQHTSLLFFPFLQLNQYLFCFVTGGFEKGKVSKSSIQCLIINCIMSSC